MLVRSAEQSDVAAVLGLFDDAVAWLVERGSAGQWGAVALSLDPVFVGKLEGWVSAGDMWLAVDSAGVAGAVAVGPAPGYAPAAAEPEVYVQGLVARRRPRACGVGSCLLAHAERLAVGSGVGVVRLDCWSGGGGRLVDYYRRAGFVSTGPVTVGAWPGQMMEKRLDGVL